MLKQDHVAFGSIEKQRHPRILIGVTGLGCQRVEGFALFERCNVNTYCQRVGSIDNSEACIAV